MFNFSDDVMSALSGRKAWNLRVFGPYVSQT